MTAVTHSPSAKVILILIDGIGDVALQPLKGLTPLQHTPTPTLDLLATHGLNGCIDAVDVGSACGSDTAHLSILGYPPQQYYRGRGGFESLGAGIGMHKGDIAFKSNFATIDPITQTVLRRRVDRSFPQWGKALVEAVDGLKVEQFPEVEVHCKWATEHRCGIRVRLNRDLQQQRHNESQVNGTHRLPQLTDNITGTDPLVDNRTLISCKPTVSADDTDAQYTSAIINALHHAIYQKLSAHPINVQRVADGLPPANIILMRGAGSVLDAPPFAELHPDSFKAACMVAPTCIIGGLGLSVGMDRLVVDGATGDYETNLIAKADALLDAMFDRQHDSKAATYSIMSADDTAGDSRKPYDFGFLHIKAVDDAGHDRSVERKCEWLQRADAMIRHLLQQSPTDEDVIYVVTGDHTTPVMYGDHSCEPVPLVICPNAHQLLSKDHAELNGVPGQRHLPAPILELLAADRVKHFDECVAATGLLGRFRAQHLMSVIKQLKRTTSSV